MGLEISMGLAHKIGVKWRYVTNKNFPHPTKRGFLSPEKTGTQRKQEKTILSELLESLS
jgi:hypothetical protein